MSQQVGTITWINGPVVRAQGSGGVSMLELVEVGEERLVGEVIGLQDNDFTIQVYEETSGMEPDAPVYGTGLPLSVELGPGLLRSIFDGIQRPLPVLEMRTGTFIDRGLHLTPLYRGDRWRFAPRLQVGAAVSGGTILGTVPETESVEHRVMVPPEIEGTLTWIAPEGEYAIDETIARLSPASGEKEEEIEVSMLQRWPVRRPRPY
ncbi:MAG: V-type ATP synthase subunit A, partial [Anaerolineae bacterium]